MQIASIYRLVFAAGLLIASLAAAGAEDRITLRYATFLSANHQGVVHGSRVFMEHVAEDSGGAVDIQFFPAEQAGKALQLFDIIRAGAVDLVEVASSYISSGKTPLIGVLEIPGLAGSACQATAALRSLAEPGGLIYESEFAPNGVLPIAFFAYPPYEPSASIKPINSVEDLRGMKLRSAGGLMERSVGKLGGVPVKLPSPEMYDALQRRTIDAVLLSYLSAEVYDLASVANYGATGYSFGTPGTIVFANARKFRSLPPKVQQALLSAGKQTEQSWCKFVDDNENKIRQRLIAEGMKIHYWTPRQQKQLDSLLASVPADWAGALESRGKPAIEVLKTFKAIAAAKGNPTGPGTESAPASPYE